MVYTLKMKLIIQCNANSVKLKKNIVVRCSNRCLIKIFCAFHLYSMKNSCFANLNTGSHVKYVAQYFFQSSSWIHPLEKSMKTPTGENLYLCDVCKSAFLLKNSHANTHWRKTICMWNVWFGIYIQLEKSHIHMKCVAQYFHAAKHMQTYWIENTFSVNSFVTCHIQTHWIEKQSSIVPSLYRGQRQKYTCTHNDYSSGDVWIPTHWI